MDRVAYGSSELESPFWPYSSALLNRTEALVWSPRVIVRMSAEQVAMCRSGGKDSEKHKSLPENFRASAGFERANPITMPTTRSAARSIKAVLPARSFVRAHI